MAAAAVRSRPQLYRRQQGEREGRAEAAHHPRAARAAHRRRGDHRPAAHSAASDRVARVLRAGGHLDH